MSGIGVKVSLGSSDGHPALLIFRWWAHDTSTGLNGDTWRPRCAPLRFYTVMVTLQPGWGHSSWTRARCCFVLQPLLEILWPVLVLPSPSEAWLWMWCANPPHPTSTGSTWACQQRGSASAAMPRYFGRLRSDASLIAASQGTVTSTNNNALCDVDHKTRSGLKLDVMISVGNTSFWPWSTCSFLFVQRIASTLADRVAFSDLISCWGGRVLSLVMLRGVPRLRGLCRVMMWAFPRSVYWGLLLLGEEPKRMTSEASMSRCTTWLLR